MILNNIKEQIIHRKLSFGYALAGYKVMWWNEINFRVHIVMAIVAIGIGILLRINTIEWIAISFCIGLVITAEIFNTAIENICDLISKEIKSEIKTIKDISAAGVLTLSVISAIVGIKIFLPKIIHTFNIQ